MVVCSTAPRRRLPQSSIRAHRRIGLNPLTAAQSFARGRCLQKWCALTVAGITSPSLGSSRRPIGAPVTPERVEDAGDFPRQRHHRHAAPSSQLDLGRPGHHRIMGSAPPRAPTRLDQCPAQLRRTCLGDPGAVLPLRARVLTRHQPQITLDRMSTAKPRHVIDRGYESHRGYRPDSGHGHQPLADWIRLRSLLQFLVRILYLVRELGDRLELSLYAEGSDCPALA